MTEPIGPGDLVECVRADPAHLYAIGRIYTVTEIGPIYSCPCNCGDQEPHGGLRVKERPCTSPRQWWCLHSFRPISRRKDFERVLEGLKEPVEVNISEEDIEGRWRP